LVFRWYQNWCVREKKCIYASETGIELPVFTKAYAQVWKSFSMTYLCWLTC
jgi:hypothetical protein